MAWFHRFVAAPWGIVGVPSTPDLLSGCARVGNTDGTTSGGIGGVLGWGDKVASGDLGVMVWMVDLMLQILGWMVNRSVHIL